MKNLIFILLLFLFPTSGNTPTSFETDYDLRLIQINSTWNDRHTIKGLDRIRSVKYEFGWLEDQEPKLKSQIKSVPVLLLYKQEKLVWSYQAGISMKAEIGVSEVSEIVSKHR